MSKSARKFLAPEVLQASAMDCGPAVLAALLKGFGLRADFNKLRDACQTDIDGTSIDAIEELANRSGLEAEQVILPADYVVHPEANFFPAIAVVDNPGGGQHFTLLWRSIGGRIQEMNPATGRKWTRPRQLESELYIHEQAIEESAFVLWFLSEESISIQGARLQALGVKKSVCARFLTALRNMTDWKTCARFDAALRMTTELIALDAIQPGATAQKVVEQFLAASSPPIPKRYYSVVPSEEEGELNMKGAVLVRVNPNHVDLAQANRFLSNYQPDRTQLAQSSNPVRELLSAISSPAAVVGFCFMLALGACGLMVESIALRGLLAVTNDLGAARFRIFALAALVLFLAILLLYDISLRYLAVDWGRRLEIKFRTAFLTRIPRLRDRYFRTRLPSDFAQRAHAAHLIRELPEFAMTTLRLWLDILVLGLGLLYLKPSYWALILGAVVVASVIPIVAHPILRDRDSAVRSHSGQLSQFFLNALIGMAPIRAHGAEISISTRYETLLSRWWRASRQLAASSVALDTFIYAATIIPIVSMVYWVFSSDRLNSSELLLIYWGMLLPQRSVFLSQSLARYPGIQNVASRLVEPLASSDTVTEQSDRTCLSTSLSQVTIEFRDVTVIAGNQAILKNIDLCVPARSHVAVLGRSGSGKSSLLSLLLGWLEPSQGTVRINDQALRIDNIDLLRRKTSWIDPSVRLWNDSMLANILYGSSEQQGTEVAKVIAQAEIRDLLDQLPEGLRTELGEDGRLLSGGQGQRVRNGRGMLRGDAALVLLDEPFRGLDREMRERMIKSVRKLWATSTLFYATHDIEHASQFDWVVIIEEGRIIEQGSPTSLAQDASSRFSAYLAAEQEVRQRLWGDTKWRRLTIEHGKLHEEDVS